MPLYFSETQVDIPSGTGRRERIIWESHPIDKKYGAILGANVALSGFKLQYDDPDHHIKVIEVHAHFENIDYTDRKILFSVDCNLADENDDDPYSGFVKVLSVVEVELR